MAFKYRLIVLRFKLVNLAIGWPLHQPKTSAQFVEIGAPKCVNALRTCFLPVMTISFHTSKGA